MDEPFAALDAQTNIVMQEELLKVFDQTHKTVLFVTQRSRRQFCWATRSW